MQQAAEKLAKCSLVLTGTAYRRTHDLDQLAALVRPLYPQFAPWLEAVRPLTIWGVAYRYPGVEDEAEPPPATEELERYAALLTAFAAAVRELIGRD